jgi:PBSX family phage terminase large subunit
VIQATDKVYKPKGQARQLFQWLDGYAMPPDEVLVEGPAGTGKSRAIGEFLYETAAKYAHTKILALRRFRTDLHRGFQQTFENMVLYPGHELLTAPGGGKDDNRVYYRWPNGSQLVLGHMEDPQRWYSSEWDIVYWNEVNEARLDQWERLDRSLRRGDRMTECPWRLKMGDTNPDSDRHWIHLRCKAGTTKRLVTRHRDNPSLEEAYLNRLRNLTGVRYRRLYLGEWCSAEGQIWDNFDSSVHIIPTEEELPEFKWYMAGMDFGYHNPGCLLVVGFSEDGCGYVIREVYRPGKHLEWWAEQIMALNAQYPLSLVVTDSADGGTGAIRWLNERINLEAPDGGALVVPVKKRKVGDKPFGYAVREHVRSLWQQRTLFVLDDPLRLVGGPDPDLTEKGQARSLTDEIPMYVYRRPPEGRELAVGLREDPDPMSADHGCNALEYLCVTAWAADFTPPEPDPGVPDFTYASLLKHDEVWSDPDPYAPDTTFDDYANSGAFIRRKR